METDIEGTSEDGDGEATIEAEKVHHLMVWILMLPWVELEKPTNMESLTN